MLHSMAGARVSPPRHNSAKNPGTLLPLSRLCFAGHSRNVSGREKVRCKRIAAPGKIVHNRFFVKRRDVSLSKDLRLRDWQWCPGTAETEFQKDAQGSK